MKQMFVLPQKRPFQGVMNSSFHIPLISLADRLYELPGDTAVKIASPLDRRRNVWEKKRRSETSFRLKESQKKGYWLSRLTTQSVVLGGEIFASLSRFSLRSDCCLGKLPVSEHYLGSTPAASRIKRDFLLRIRPIFRAILLLT